MSFNLLNLQRRAGDHFDKDGSFFLRLEEDGLPTHSGPFIKAINVDKLVTLYCHCCEPPRHQQLASLRYDLMNNLFTGPSSLKFG